MEVKVVDGKPSYIGRMGTVTYIGDSNQTSGNWGRCSLVLDMYGYVVMYIVMNGGKER